MVLAVERKGKVVSPSRTRPGGSVARFGASLRALGSRGDCERTLAPWAERADSPLSEIVAKWKELSQPSARPTMGEMESAVTAAFDPIRRATALVDVEEVERALATLFRELQRAATAYRKLRKQLLPLTEHLEGIRADRAKKPENQRRAIDRLTRGLAGGEPLAPDVVFQEALEQLHDGFELHRLGVPRQLAQALSSGDFRDHLQELVTLSLRVSKWRDAHTPKRRTRAKPANDAWQDRSMMLSWLPDVVTKELAALDALALDHFPRSPETAAQAMKKADNWLTKYRPVIKAWRELSEEVAP